MTSDSLISRLLTVREIISGACQKANRNENDVRLVAVTKTRPVPICEEAYGEGLLDLGENYVQEWDAKASALAQLDPPIRWHMIGRMQSNKIRNLVGRTHLIHTVDRAKLIEGLHNRGEQIGEKVSFLLQVNIAGESQKGGCAIEETLELAQRSFALSHVTLCGLMTVAPFSDDPEISRPVFRQLRQLLDTIRDAASPEDRQHLKELSMGMSGDLAVAVEEGATLVRVGSALFGPRT